ncbi:Schizosaccharomyces specific protein [Schizosaccharomyces osmophilus]|uniref:Schizosaccharomyces specific protein n=1 Tax=Schizosaccharomyces osmophilus TaxID=2545709 RepID=A0AAE9W7Q3_9SCHI|nr:Schizosaccharomyces specific protein [Schizosaccharomyces osmophilus]WBW70930.1 Schizosaccharomyces specific protein [Schizosaccharomyces osmophilus]
MSTITTPPSNTLSQQDFSLLQFRLLDFLASQESRKVIAASKELTLLRQSIQTLKNKATNLKPEEMTLEEKQSAIRMLQSRISLKKSFLSRIRSESETAQDISMQEAV